MDLYAALEISDTCDLCGRCDYQCCFVTGMRPTVVVSALKLFIADHFIAVPERRCSGRSLTRWFRKYGALSEKNGRRMTGR